MGLSFPFSFVCIGQTRFNICVSVFIYMATSGTILLVLAWSGTFSPVGHFLHAV